ncbi:MAG: GntR family transcriptional regulator [Velocimicrobium sp.]
MQNSKFMTSEEVYEDLCLKIEKLVYMPGESISENDLCKTYDVSRHIIRGAITRAKARRLLTVYPQRGTFVSLIDMRYVEDILYLRESIEQEALRRIMNLDETSIVELVKHLKKNVNEQKRVIKKEITMDEFYVIDNIYHSYLLKAVDKEQVMNLVKEQYIHVRRWRNFEVRNMSRLEEIIQDHEKLIETIKTRDGQGGWECLHVHLDTVTRLSDIFKTVQAEYFIF